MTTTGSTYTSRIDFDANGILTEQDELAAVLALAPPLTPQARKDIDRAHDEALKATRKAVGCDISRYAEDERRCTDCGHLSALCSCPHICSYEDADGWPVQGDGEHIDDYNVRMEAAMFGEQDADLDESA